ncbi:hypothetical protein BS78_03G129000 [Paspalum vaginatum]|nr:hypothetical protein BS78_03G129000 [Paspalum vaginatum]KAJ1283444.1 hypothetical protein BS78_03G129000 [Paspalum vaginatum]
MAQWQCFVCFAIVAASVAASLVAIIRRTNRRWPLPPPRAGSAAAPPWASCWSRVPPAWLLAFRATAAAALAAVLAWDLRTYDASIMLYYTEWTLVLEIGYFAAATLCSAYGCLATYRRRSRADDPEGADDGRLLCRSGGGGEQDPKSDGDGAWEWPAAGRLGLLMQIGYQVTAGAVVLTDAVFWGLIVPFISSAHFSLNAVMVCIHSVNLVFLLPETALNTLAFPWFRMAYFVLWTCLYVIVQWIAHLCGLTWWPYPFLSPTASSAPLWYLAMAVLHFPCYLVYWLIVRAKSCCFIHMQAATRS